MKMSTGTHLKIKKSPNKEDICGCQLVSMVMAWPSNDVVATLEYAKLGGMEWI